MSQVVQDLLKEPFMSTLWSNKSRLVLGPRRRRKEDSAKQPLLLRSSRVPSYNVYRNVQSLGY
jgi:hypothetical protein